MNETINLHAIYFLSKNPWYVHALIYTFGILSVTVQHLYSYYLGLFIFMSCVLPCPFLLPQTERTHRALTCFTSLFYFCRMFQIKTKEQNTREQENNRPLWLKIAHVFGTFMDTRTIEKSGPLDKKEKLIYRQHLWQGCLHVGGILLLIPIIRLCLVETTAWKMAIATLCAGICSLFFLTAFGQILIGGWGLSQNVRLPWLMKAPILSTSLREFWGRRWNGVIQRMLKTQVYDRCRRTCGMNKRVASVVTFMCSGIIHAYPVFVAHAATPGIDATMYPVILALSYFLIQVVCMFVQDVVGKFSNVYLQRIVTLFFVAFPGPLLVVVFLTLPLSPDGEELKQCTKIVTSKEFIQAWSVLSCGVAIVLGVGAECLSGGDIETITSPITIDNLITNIENAKQYLEDLSKKEIALLCVQLKTTSNAYKPKDVDALKKTLRSNFSEIYNKVFKKKKRGNAYQRDFH